MLDCGGPSAACSLVCMWLRATWLRLPSPPNAAYLSAAVGTRAAPARGAAALRCSHPARRASAGSACTRAGLGRLAGHVGVERRRVLAPSQRCRSLLGACRLHGSRQRCLRPRVLLSRAPRPGPGGPAAAGGVSCRALTLCGVLVQGC